MSEKGELNKNTIPIHVTEVGGCIIKRLLREQGYETTEELNYYALLGTMIHKVSELVIDSIIARNGTLPFDEAIEKAGEDNYEFYVANDMDIRERAEKLYSWLAQETVDGNIYHIRSTEENLRVELPNEYSIDGVPFEITGTLDLSIYLNEGELDDEGDCHVQIIDLKSGKTRSKKHAWQVSAYAHLLEMLQAVKVDSARIVYLGTPFEERKYKNGKVTRKHERFLSRADLDKYFEEWRDTLYEYVEALIVNWDDPPVAEEEHSDCFFCPYHGFCWGEGGYKKGGYKKGGYKR